MRELKGKPQAIYLLHSGKVVVTGIPHDDPARTEDEQHNCDEMGCTSLEHVLLRAKVAKLGTD